MTAGSAAAARLRAAVFSAPLPEPRLPAFRFTLCWLAASIISVLGFGTYFEQYLLPVFVPASAAAAPFFDSASRRRVATLLTAAFLLGQTRLAVTQVVHGSRKQLAEIVRHIDTSRCLYIYSGLSAIYQVSNACIPTRFAFPSHMSRAREAHATGVEPVQEVDRILRTHPGNRAGAQPLPG